MEARLNAAPGELPSVRSPATFGAAVLQTTPIKTAHLAHKPESWQQNRERKCEEFRVS